MIFKALLLCTVLTLSCVSCDVITNGPCKVQRLDGICIPITSCKFALTILSINDVQTLRSMFCGFNGSLPKVCCPLPKKNDRTTTQNTQPTTQNLVFEVVENEVVTAPTRPAPPITAPPQAEPFHKAPPQAEPFYKVPQSTAPPYTMPPYTRPPFAASSTVRTTTPPPPTANPLLLPSRDVCGQIADEDRIYGGDIAAIDEFPWLVRIKFLIPTTRQETYACSGALISDRYVLTAAHCLTVYKIVNVRLGEWDTESEVDCYNGYCNDGPLDVNVDRTIIHPSYDRRDLSRGDIALLRLEHPVKFTDFIKPVCLPTTEYIARQDYIDSTFTAAGWGKTEFGQVSVLQRKVNVDSVSYSICSSALPSLPKTEDPYVICAGGKKGRDTCQGDSGGPLVRIERENYKQNWFVYGITSHGAVKCGSAGRPAVYTRVSKYMDWILDNISEG